MSVVITREDLKSYAEVDYIIHHMNERYIAMIPENLLNFFATIKDKDHQIYINPHKPLQEQGLSKYALEIIALLHVKYWCVNKERKEELIEKMKENEEKFEAQLKEQFNTENIFKNNNETDSEVDPLVSAYSKYTNQNPDIQDYTDLREEENIEELPENVVEKKSIFSKIKSLIAGIFGKNKS